MTTHPPSDPKALRNRWLPFFDTLWKAYPLHQDYGGAFNAFMDLINEGDVDPQYVLEKAEAYSRNVDNVKWVPHLKTWIRNRRFEDEDIFTDQAVAQREWFVGVWQRADTTAIGDKYGFIYTHPPVPEEVEDLDAWHTDQRKLWIGKVARHILHGEPFPE